MGRPRTEQHIIDAVEQKWDDWNESTERQSRTATAVWERYFKHIMGKRTVQLIIKEYRKPDATRGNIRVLPEPWGPWVSLMENAEDADFLLQLNAVSNEFDGWNLYKHQAEWAGKLRFALKGLNPFI